MPECEPTQTPEIDHAALRAKYLSERDKRLRPEGQKQYLVTEGEFEEFYVSDPYLPVAARAPIHELATDVVVLGGGFAGLVAATRIIQAGVTDLRIIELGGDFGGAWYWNRYPGIQCDTDSYCYLPMLEETGYMPKEKYAHGDEVFEYAQRIGNHFGLYDKAIFHTLIRSLEWDDSIRRWRIGTNRGDDIRARFVVMCQGPFNRPKLPGIPGITDFKGHTFHTARWDYEYTGGDISGGLAGLAGKRVAVIGTGASGIQAIPHVARSAEHLFVFQRTPSYIDDRGDVPTDPEWVKTLQPGWQAERQRNFHTAAFEAFAPGQPDLICDAWTEVSRNIAAHLDATAGWADLTPEKFMEIREIQDYRAMERQRRRVEATVDDPETAEALKPYYRFLCKRPCFSDEYLPTFNLSNVTLVDVSATKGVERITENGIIAHGTEYEVDCIIFASGFEITTDLDRRLGIAPFAGRGGQSLYDHWANGYRTLHGITSHGFPNLLWTGFVQGGVTANTIDMFEQQARQISYIIGQALARGAATVEPSPEAVDEWCTTVQQTSTETWITFNRECTPGYYNSEGEQRIRSHLGEPYWLGFWVLEDLLQAWRDAGDMKGLVLDA
jgi:cyclohexanone monooxygenase